MGRLTIWQKAVLMVVWVVLILYPNASMLATSIVRVIHPPVDAAAVAELASEMPDDPSQIEYLVLTKYVPYACDWVVFSVPWYFPSPAEVLVKRQGDCEARAMLLASILEAKQIPYELKISPVHIWVDYAGKVQSSLENENVTWAERVDDSYRLKFPTNFNLAKYTSVEMQALWEPMPTTKKVILFTGVALIVAANPILCLLFGKKTPDYLQSKRWQLRFILREREGSHLTGKSK